MGAGISSGDEDNLRQEEIEELEAMSGFDRDEIKKLYKRFKTLDRNGKGILTEEDLKRIPEVALNPLSGYLMLIFGFDAQKKATINFTDFIRALSSFNKKKSKEEMLNEVFSIFDSNGDGKISKQELTRLIRTLIGEQGLSEEDLTELIDLILIEADDDGDQQLSFEEFKRVLEGTNIDAKLDRKSTVRVFSSSAHQHHRTTHKKM